MSSRPVRKWVKKQIDQAIDHEKSKLVKVRSILKELDVMTTETSDDPELTVIDAGTKVKLALSIIGE